MDLRLGYLLSTTGEYSYESSKWSSTSCREDLLTFAAPMKPGNSCPVSVQRPGWSGRPKATVR